jgi:hypothetical protein
MREHPEVRIIDDDPRVRVKFAGTLLLLVHRDVTARQEEDSIEKIQRFDVNVTACIFALSDDRLFRDQLWPSRD